MVLKTANNQDIKPRGPVSSEDAQRREILDNKVKKNKNGLSEKLDNSSLAPGRNQDKSALHEQQPRKFFNTPKIKKRSFSSVPDHPSYWEYGVHGVQRRPRHQLKLGGASCRWISYHKKYGIPKWLLSFGKKLLMTTDNKHPSRKFAILNEVAEALRESMHNMMPGPLAQIIYKGLWSLTGAYLGVRNLVTAVDEHSLTAGLKKVSHDLIAAVSLPVVAVRITGKAVNKVFGVFNAEKSPLADLVRPMISYMAASFALGKLDPLVENFIHKISPYTFNKVEKWIDGQARSIFGSLAKAIFKKSKPSIKSFGVRV